MGDRKSKIKVLDKNFDPTLADIGLTKGIIYEARLIRDAEKRKPGMIQKLLDAKLEAHEEPTRADIKRAVKENICEAFIRGGDADVSHSFHRVRLALGGQSFC